MPKQTDHYLSDDEVDWELGRRAESDWRAAQIKDSVLRSAEVEGEKHRRSRWDADSMDNRMRMTTSTPLRYDETGRTPGPRNQILLEESADTYCRGRDLYPRCEYVPRTPSPSVYPPSGLLERPICIPWRIRRGASVLSPSAPDERGNQSGFPPR